MKRILAVLLAVMLFVAVIPATSLAEGVVSNGDTPVYHVQTKGSILHLRVSPGTSSGVRADLPNGTALKKISSKKVKKDGYTWINVKTMTGLEGWVASSLVKEKAKVNVNTKKDPLRVRSSRNASSDKNIIYRLPHGTKGVIVYKVNGNWAYVNYSGNSRKGWASLSYLVWTRW